MCCFALIFASHNERRESPNPNNTFGLRKIWKNVTFALRKAKTITRYWVTFKS